MASLYTRKDIVSAYEVIQEHRRAKSVILAHASNPRDIREVALEGLDLSGAHRVLDLGCGYGFFTEGLKGRLRADARILGIDLVERDNRAVFLETVTGMGYSGEFICAPAEIIQGMDGAAFDLIIASYSLYFFPHLIHEIARVLSPEGLFIAVTHSRHSLKEVTSLVPRCMEKAGVVPPPEITLIRLFGSFCLENGRELLAASFDAVERIVYPNELIFPLERVDECIDYLDTKRHLMFKDAMESHPMKIDDMVTLFHDMVFEYARASGEIVLSKDDAVFRCRRPRRGA